MRALKTLDEPNASVIKYKSFKNNLSAPGPFNSVISGSPSPILILYIDNALSNKVGSNMDKQ